MQDKIMIIGAGVPGELISKLATAETTVIVVSPEQEAARSPFDTPPIPFSRVEPVPDMSYVIDREKKNFITGKKLPRLKRRK